MTDDTGKHWRRVHKAERHPDGSLCVGEPITGTLITGNIRDDASDEILRDSLASYGHIKPDDDVFVVEGRIRLLSHK